MLKVTIANIDSTFTGVFDTDNADAAVNAAVAELIEKHGFFDTCYAYRHPKDKAVYGFVMNKSQEGDDAEWLAGHENTHTIWVTQFSFGVMDNDDEEPK